MRYVKTAAFLIAVVCTALASAATHDASPQLEIRSVSQAATGTETHLVGVYRSWMHGDPMEPGVPAPAWFLVLPERLISGVTPCTGETWVQVEGAGISGVAEWGLQAGERVEVFGEVYRDAEHCEIRLTRPSHFVRRYAGGSAGNIDLLDLDIQCSAQNRVDCVLAYSNQTGETVHLVFVLTDAATGILKGHAEKCVPTGQGRVGFYLDCPAEPIEYSVEIRAYESFDDPIQISINCPTYSAAQILHDRTMRGAVLRYDANRDGRIDESEELEAYRDYLNGHISMEEICGVDLFYIRECFPADRIAASEPIICPCASSPSGRFEGMDFSGGCIETGGYAGSIRVSLEYRNDLGEDATVLFLFSRAAGGEVIAHSAPIAPQGHGTVEAIFSCPDGQSGEYKITWKAYRASDTKLENPVKWSLSTESVRVHCPCTEDEPEVPPSNAPFIREWLVLGPFAHDSSQEEQAFGTDYIGEESVQPSPGSTSGGKTWSAYNSATDFVDFEKAIGTYDHAVGYAHVYIESPKSQTVQLRLGSDDAIKAWLNGTLVHDNYANRGWEPDQDIVAVNLESGWNRLLIKVLDHVGGWGFIARLTTPDGDAVGSLEYSLTSAGNTFLMLRQTALEQRLDGAPLIVSYEPSWGKPPLETVVTIQSRTSTFYAVEMVLPDGTSRGISGTLFLPPKASGTDAIRETVTFDRSAGSTVMEIRATRNSWEARLVNVLDAIFIGIPIMGGRHIDVNPHNFMTIVSLVGGFGGRVVSCLIEGDWDGAFLETITLLGNPAIAQAMLKALGVSVAHTGAVVQFAQGIDLLYRLYIMGETFDHTFKAPMNDQVFVFVDEIEIQYAPPSVCLDSPLAGEIITSSEVTVTGEIVSSVSIDSHPVNARLLLDGDPVVTLSLESGEWFSASMEVDRGIHIITVEAENEGCSNRTDASVAILVQSGVVSGCISGEVTVDTLPIPRARVEVADPSGSTRTTRTDNLGRYRFDDVPVDSGYTVSVTQASCAAGCDLPAPRHGIAVGVGDCTEVNFELDRSQPATTEDGRVEGIVTDSDGKGIRATVSVEGPTNRDKRSGSSGRYEIPDLLPGRYTVRVVAPDGYRAVDSPQRITVSGGDTRMVNFHLEKLPDNEADLRVRSIGYMQPLACPGDAIGVKISIHNSGRKQAPRYNVCVNLLQRDGSGSVICHTTVMVDGTQARRTSDVWATLHIPDGLSYGDYTTRVVVDCSGEVDESDEGNNEATKRLRVGGCSPGVGAYFAATGPVDLVVTSPDGTALDEEAVARLGGSLQYADLNDDDVADVELSLPSAEEGTYHIVLVPRDDAEPDDLVTLEAISGGLPEALLGDNTVVADIEGVTESYEASGTIAELLTLEKGMHFVSTGVDLDAAAFGTMSTAAIRETMLWDSDAGRWLNPSIQASWGDPLAGFYVWTDAEQTLVVAGTPRAGEQKTVLSDAGWHAIGVPYEVAWGFGIGGTISVKRHAESVSLADAVREGWIHPVVSAWSTKAKDWVHIEEGTLDPWKGYWILTYVDDLTLCFSETPTFGETLPGPARSAQAISAIPSPFEEQTKEEPGAMAVVDRVAVLCIPNPVEKDGATFSVRGICHCRVNGLRVSVYDLAGRLLWDDRSTEPELEWNGRTSDGEHLANGAYIYAAAVNVEGSWVPCKPTTLMIAR